VVKTHKITLVGPFCTSEVARYVELEDWETWLCECQPETSTRQRLLDLAVNGITQRDAASTLGITRRHARRLIRELASSGALVTTGTRPTPGRYTTIYRVPDPTPATEDV